MSDDLISRQEATQTALEFIIEYLGGAFDEDFQRKLIGRMNALPSADRPQGEWIDAEIPLESGGAMPIQACSLCKTFYPLAYTGGGHRFCPNCGARMKGADDEVSCR